MDIVRMTLVGLSIFAGVGAYVLFSQQPGPAREPLAAAASVPQIDMEDVLVSVGDLPAGKTLSESDFIWQPWPANTVQSSMIRRRSGGDVFAEIRGAFVRVPMSAGEPLRRDKIIRAGRAGGYMAATLPPGMRAVAIPVDGQGVASAGGFILPNDRVDVIRIGRDEEGRSTDAIGAQTILTNMRVLAVGQNIQERMSDRNVIGPTVTLEATPDQAETLILAQRTGQLSLALRALADTGAGQTQAGPRESTLSIIRYGVVQGGR